VMNRKTILSFGAAVALLANAGLAAAQPPNPGTGTSFGRVMNVGSGAGAVVVQYVDSAGNVAASRNVSSLAQYGATTIAPSAGDVTPALPGGWSGSVIASSDQPLVGLTYLNWTGGGGGVGFCQIATGLCGDDKHSADYNATTAPSDNLFFPSVARRDQEAGKIYVQNTNPPGGASATAYFNFYDRFGTPFSGNPVLRTIPAGAQVTIDMFTAPETSGSFFTASGGFLGSVYVTATQPIAGAAIHTWFYGSFAYTAKPRSAAGTNILFPKVVRRCLFGQGCVNAASSTEPNFTDSTGVVCANTSETQPASITITFTNRAGTVESTYSDTIAPLSSKGYNTRFGANLPVAQRDLIRGLDLGGTSSTPAFVGSAQVTSNQPLICIAKQLYDKDSAAINTGDPDAVSRQSLGYNGINLSDAKTEIFLPIAWRINNQPVCGFWRYTGLIVQNAGAGNANVTVRAYNNAGTLINTWNDPAPLAPFTPRGYNTRFNAGSGYGTDGAVIAALGANFDGTLRLTSTQPLVAVAESWQNCDSGSSPMTDSNITELN
jgi:hypothetical protein